MITRITVVLDVDLDDKRSNGYTLHPEHRHIGDAIEAGALTPVRGPSAYIEFGTGDCAQGTLVSITAEPLQDEPGEGR